MEVPQQVSVAVPPPTPLGAPSASFEESFDVEFKDITYTVTSGLFRKERKCLLRGVSGLFRAGELSVVVGVSGAGKSTLMDILSGYTASSSGSVWIGGVERANGRRACYILQDCALQGTLTVAEALRVAADLKLPRCTEKHLRVEEIIVALGLSKCRHTRTASLSGGQRKRLTIAMELTSDPPIMFLDEPTSGLDISTMKQLVSLLHTLAGQGRTLVVTMHQPSTPVLQMVDRLYAISAGRCVYQGAVSQLVPFLNAHDLPCPPYHNPVDVLMEVCSGTTGTSLADSLAETCRNSHYDRWVDPLPMSAVVRKIETPFFNDSTNGKNGLMLKPVSKVNNSRQRLHRYPTSFWNQLSVLFFRSIKLVIRDPILSGMNIFIHCTIGLLIGLLYYNIGKDAQNILNNFHYMVFSVMFTMFTAFSAVSIKFPYELPVIRREHFNRWYSTRAYYVASLAASIPVHALCSVLYSAISYWLTGQPWQASRAISFAGILILVSLIAMAFGLLTGASFSVKNGTIFGPFVIMPFLLFCGLFLRYSDAPTELRWLFSASFMKHGVVGLSLAIFGKGRPRLDCTAEYCHYVYPSLFLKDFDMADTEYYQTVIALVGFLACVITLTYFILNFKLKHKR